MIHLQEKIQSIVRRAIAEKVFPGCVIGIVNREGERNVWAFGNYTYDQSSAPMQADSIFDVASITKLVPTSLLILQLIERGKLNLDDLISKYLPEITSHAGRIATIKHLLTFTYLVNTGQHLSTFKHLPAGEILSMLFSVETIFPPGTHFQYSNTPSIFLGLIAERVTGMPLPQLAQTFLFDPLEMFTTTFEPQKYPLSRIVPTEIDTWRGTVQGVVHDEASWALQKSFYPGCAGVFSTNDDLLNCMWMLLNQGKYHHTKILSAQMIEQMFTNQLGPIQANHGLGIELNQPQYMGIHCQDMFGKTGFTGTVCLGSLKKGLAAVIFTNRCYPTRPLNGDSINHFRANISTSIFT